MILKQPELGVISTLLCIIFALGICALFTVDTFNSWVGFLAVAAIPGQIILALVWESNYPKILSRISQPCKGIALFAFMIIVGCISAAISMILIGGNVTPPSPILINFTILSVVITMWTVVAWQCWPMSAVSKHQGIIGIGTLLISYLLSYVIFSTSFNFGSMADAPFYSSESDPQGLLNSWTAITYFLTTVAVIDAFILLDFWPISSLKQRLNIDGKQPWDGLLNTIAILGLAYIIWLVFIKVFNFEIVDYMVRIIVSFVFGEFIMLVMMQTAPFNNLKQPLKGLCLLICCALLAIIVYPFYSFSGSLLLGSIPQGPPTYDFDLWLATAMLSITFPLLIIFADFFNFWPLAKQPKK